MQKTIYTATCLSPVHIGTGNKFGRFDGVYANGRWSVIDLDKVLEKGVDPQGLAEAMNDSDFNWQSLLSQHKLKVADVAVYSIACSMPPADNSVREAIKDAYRRPYLPGSSVKGAVRTAIVWGLLKNDPDSLSRTEQHLLQIAYADQRLPKSPAQPIEQHLLGQDPNHDLMRALHVIDSSTVGTDRLAAGLVWTYSLSNGRMVEKRENGNEFKTSVEWLTPQTELTVDVSLDNYLLTAKEPIQKNQSRPIFNQTQHDALRQLAQFCNNYASAVIAEEKKFLAEHWSDEVKSVQQFYEEREKELKELGDTPTGAFLLNVGWGGGWEAKTVGNQIRAMLSEADFRQLRERYRLGKKPLSPREDTSYLKGYFPHSRHIAYLWNRLPMGWLRFDPKGAVQ
jgi:CRISPR-associated protein Csm5